MNCCIGEELNELGDWSVNLPEFSSEERLANKNYHPPPRRGSECTGRRYCLRHEGYARTWNLSGVNTAAAEYTSETFSAVSKGPLQQRERVSRVKDTHHWSQDKQNWLLRAAGCQEGCLADSERGMRVHTQTLRAISVTQCKSLVPRMEVCMGLIHKALLNPVTLTGLNNYRSSRRADTCNLTDLVRFT